MKKCPVCKRDIKEKEPGFFRCLCGYTECIAISKVSEPKLIDAYKLMEDIKKMDLEYMQQADIMECLKDTIDRQPAVLTQR